MNADTKIIINDITALDVEAIVNAANNRLLGGGGVDDAIHRAAGTQMIEAYKKVNGCQTGEAKITDDFNLNARHVIHTVGPVWQNGSENEHLFLANCYRNSIRIADEKQLKSIAFPSFSTEAMDFSASLLRVLQ